MPEDQAGLHQAPPFVSLQCECRIQRFAGTAGKPPAAAERDGLGSRAPGYGVEEGVAAFSDRAGALEAGAWDEQARPRIADAERSKPVELLGQAEAQVGSGDDRVHPLHRAELVCRQYGAGVTFERFGERW
jgi:hypothetical protein